MIKTIIKRDGTKEDFSADKINGWSEWASKTLGRYVNWSEVVVNTVGTLPSECTSQELQESLIRYCLGKHTWEYNRMAGRLYSSLLTRLIHKSDKYPTVKEVHDQLYKDGLMKKLDYSDEEYAEVEKIIDHSINLKYPHYALHQNRMKYSLCNRVTGKEYETSQIMYMRMAMSASEYEPKDKRMQSVREYYDAFANHRLNVPTPFYLNLGTKLNGYASCFPKGSMVNTNNGFKAIEDISVDEYVLTHEKNWKRVNGIQNKPYNGKFITLNTVSSYTDEIRPTGEHLIYAIKRKKGGYQETLNDNKPEWVRADSLAVGDYVKLVYDSSIKDEAITIWDIIKEHELIKDKYILDGNDIKRITPYIEDGSRYPIIKNINIFNKDFFRFIGYFIAEGSLIKPKDRLNGQHLSLTFNSNEREYIEDTLGILTSFATNIKEYTSEGRNWSNVRSYSKVLYALLDILVGCGGANLKMHTYLQVAPIYLQEELLIGAIRGDGCSSARGFSLTMYNAYLIRQIRDIALRCKLYITLSCGRKLRKGAKHISCTLNFIVNSTSYFAKKVNKDLHKISSDKDDGINLVYLDDGAYARLKNLNSYEEECTVYDLSVDDDHSFSVGGIAVHNCCIHTIKDEVESLATGDHISYMMTAMSAGIGFHIKTRSLHDPVRGGAISHYGKLPYLRAHQASVSANKQSGGRGGASTTSFNLYDPEISSLLKLKNPITPLAKQIRGLDYSFGSNRLLVQKAGRNEDIALFSYYGNEELYEAIYSGDPDYFEYLYNEFVKSDKPRTMVSARKILVSALGEEFDTGRMYEHFTDSMNNHTPFLDKIYSSNLCLTGDTILDVKSNGIEYKVTLKDVVNSQDSFEVKSYNIDTKKVEYKLISAKALTAKNAKLMRIEHSTGNYIECTPEHKVYTSNRGYIEAQEVLSTDKLVIDGIQDNTDELLTIVNLANQEDVYDITVEDNHNFFANGILVHNCQEIFLPTAGFENIMELYSSYDEERNYILFQSDDSDYMYKIYNFAKVSTKRGDIYALKLQKGDTVTIPEINKTVKVHKVIKREQAGEIALCNIGGIIVSNIPDDETYSRVAKISLKLVHFGITHSDYVFKSLEETAKARMNAGIGIVGLAELMAKKGFKYSTQEGKNFIHEVAESHYWHLLNASLELSEEYGNADWMYKTKWVDGWTPLDTYSKEVDNLVTVGNKRDWVGISKRIKDNGGHAFSVLVSHMPSESSSISGATTNGVYPIRNYFLNKTNDSLSLSYVVPDSTRLKDKYESAWDISVNDMIEVYAIIQKWTDQGISSDYWFVLNTDTKVSASDMIKQYIMRYKYGHKSKYYTNSLTSKKGLLDVPTESADQDCENCSI